MRRYYRAEYGDTEPVRVLPAVALDFDGRLRQHYYKSEAMAWAAILGNVAESKDHAEARYQKLERALDAAADDMIRRRAAHWEVARNYESWRKRHPMRATA